MNCFGDYHLLLAHIVLSDPKGWADYYQDKRRRDPDTVVILDNSLIELGAPLAPEALAEATSIVQPDFLVMPDKLGDWRATVAASVKFCDDYDTRVPGWVEFAGVVQGTTYSELRECANELLDFCYPRIGALHVPRHVTNNLGTRRQIVEELARTAPDMQVHLLGFSDNLLDDMECAALPCVAGIDSAYPVWARKRLLRRRNYDHTGKRPADFWTWGPGNVDLGLIKYNIGKLRRWTLGLGEGSDSGRRHQRQRQRQRQQLPASPLGR
jgi:hypothetical protein